MCAELDRIAEGGRPRRIVASAAGAQRNRCPEIDGDRQDEPARVVGVLADQVDAGRREDRKRTHRFQRPVMSIVTALVTRAEQPLG